MSAPAQDASNSQCDRILIVSHQQETVGCVKTIMGQLGYECVIANDAPQAIAQFEQGDIAYVLIDVILEHECSDKLISKLRRCVNNGHIPIIVLASSYDEDQLSSCNTAGCNDFIFKPFTTMAFSARITSLQQIGDLEHLYNGSLNEQLVARRILNNALAERTIKFDEIDYISIPKSIFSGDLFLTARHPDGSLNVLLADFTGHGLSAAIGALPVADVFSAMTRKGFDLDYILENINNRLCAFLPASMFMACSALSIRKDLKRLRVWNGGMPDIYIREHVSGDVSNSLKSSHIPLGIDEAIENRFEPEVVQLAPGDQIILYTDGLTESMNAERQMFGDTRMHACLGDCQDATSVFTDLVTAFDEFCGVVEPIDDVTLVCIPCVDSLMQPGAGGKHAHEDLLRIGGAGYA